MLMHARICGANSNCNNVSCTLSMTVTSSNYDNMKVTTWEGSNIDHHVAGHNPVGIDGTYIVNVPPKVTTASTSAGVDVVTQVTTICHPVTITTHEVTSLSCSPVTTSEELDANKHVGLSDVDGMELNDQMIFTY